MIQPLCFFARSGALSAPGSVAENRNPMTVIVVPLPENCCHDHFDLTVTVTVKLQPGELLPEDAESLETVLRASKRNARRLAKLDAQTQ